MVQTGGESDRYGSPVFFPGSETAELKEERWFMLRLGDDEFQGEKKKLRVQQIREKTQNGGEENRRFLLAQGSVRGLVAKGKLVGKHLIQKERPPKTRGKEKGGQSKTDIGTRMSMEHACKGQKNDQKPGRQEKTVEKKKS